MKVPAEKIKPAGFNCPECRKGVEKLVVPMPSVFILHLYACRCGAVVVWADESQPCRKTWKRNLRLLKSAGAEVLMFNGNRPLSPAVMGIN